jgi:hypothetical protein
MGPAVAYAFLTRYSASWRGVYYLLLAVNVTALICWVAFYFPPTFEVCFHETIAMTPKF